MILVFGMVDVEKMVVGLNLIVMMLMKHLLENKLIIWQYKLFKVGYQMLQNITAQNVPYITQVYTQGKQI